MARLPQLTLSKSHGFRGFSISGLPGLLTQRGTRRFLLNCARRREGTRFTPSRSSKNRLASSRHLLLQTSPTHSARSKALWPAPYPCATHRAPDDHHHAAEHLPRVHVGGYAPHPEPRDPESSRRRSDSSHGRLRSTAPEPSPSHGPTSTPQADERHAAHGSTAPALPTHPRSPRSRRATPRESSP